MPIITQTCISPGVVQFASKDPRPFFSVFDKIWIFLCIGLVFYSFGAPILALFLTQNFPSSADEKVIVHNNESFEKTFSVEPVTIARKERKAFFLIIFTLFPLVLRIVYNFHNWIQEERMLIQQDFGIQIERTYFSGKTHQVFCPSSEIIEILILEGFHKAQVIFYLAIVMQGRDRLVLPFVSLFPRLKPLESIYSTCLSLLKLQNKGKM